MANYIKNTPDAVKLRAYLEGLSIADRRVFMVKVIDGCGKPVCRQTFYNWKYGLCRIPDCYKRIIENVAKKRIFK